MLKNFLPLIFCIFFFLNHALEGKIENEISYEDLSTYCLTERQLFLLKQALELAVHMPAKELGYIITHSFLTNETPFMKDINAMSKQEKTRYLFFSLTNPEIRPYLDSILEDRAKLQLYRYILGYLERDMEELFLDFNMLRENAATLARLINLEESIIISYLDEQDYVSLFLYLSKFECPSLIDEMEEAKSV